MDNLKEYHCLIGCQKQQQLQPQQDIIGDATQQVLSIPLKEAFWQCSHEFNKKGKVFKEQDFKRVWLFTNDDNPNCKLPQEQMQIIQVAKDVAEAGIEISLWHLNKGNRSFLINKGDFNEEMKSTPSILPFNIDIFYNKLLVVDDEEDFSYRTKGGGDEGFDTMLAQVRRKEFKKRRMGSLRLELGGEGEGTAISVYYYKTLNITKKPYATKLYAPSNQPVIIRSKYVDMSTGEVLNMDDNNNNSSSSSSSSSSSTRDQVTGGISGDISTYIDVQGDRIPFTRAEIQALVGVPSNMGTTITAAASSSSATTSNKIVDGGDIHQQGRIKLLYFTTVDALQADMNISTPYFIYPDDRRISGSRLLFTALLDNMCVKQLIAVGIFLRNKSSAPRLVALYPQKEQLDEEVSEGYNTIRSEFNKDDVSAAYPVSYSGFYMIPLPYAGDIRATSNITPGNNNNNVQISAEVFTATNELINGCQLDRESFSIHRMRSNPAIQRFYHVMQAIALNEDPLINRKNGGSGDDGGKLDEQDDLWPDRDMLARNIDAFDAFKTAIGLEAFDRNATTAGGKGNAVRKRSAAEASNNSGATSSLGGATSSTSAPAGKKKASLR